MSTSRCHEAGSGRRRRRSSRLTGVSDIDTISEELWECNQPTVLLAERPAQQRNAVPGTLLHLRTSNAHRTNRWREEGGATPLAVSRPRTSRKISNRTCVHLTVLRPVFSKLPACVLSRAGTT